MAIELNIHETKTRLSELLQYVEQGETVIIANAGKPVAQITKYTAAKPTRKPGRLKHLAADFDLDVFNRADKEIAAMFTAGEILPPAKTKRLKRKPAKRA
jgi:prevent-host-death family protein